MENTEIKVSVIIPVYNTEKYVRQAIDSIRKQTLKELEIIVVNDGSTDGSLRVLEEAQREDSRIQVYSQPNQGQSVARNEGMQHAKGKYLYFMDSDDLLEQDALEICYGKCEEAALDFTFFDAETFNECPGTIFNMDYHHHNIENRIYNGLELLEYLIDTHQLKIPVYMCFINTVYLASIPLRFHPGIIHEDELFTMLLYANAERVAYIPRSFFHRRIRQASTMTQRISWRNVEGYMTVFQQLQIYVSDKKEARFTKIVRKHLIVTLNAFVYNAHTMTVNNKIKFMKTCLQKGYMKHIRLKNFIRFLLT